MQIARESDASPLGHFRRIKMHLEHQWSHSLNRLMLEMA
jgi:hypothetical protein